MRLLHRIAASLALLTIASTASAGVLGTPVTGEMLIGGNPPNYFNSSAGLVPAGCQNSGNGLTTVTIVNPAAEFCFRDGANAITVNISDTTLTLTDVSAGNTLGITYRFTFAPGLVSSVTELNDNFAGAGVSPTFSANVLTLVASNFTPAGTYTATYSLAPRAVPEPSTLALLGLVAVGAFAAKRRRIVAKR